VARIARAPDERRSELITCAQKLFYTKGYESTSVSDIVTEVGAAKGTFYYYFESKQAVLAALVAELSEQGLKLYEAIVADKTLNAVQRWMQTAQVIGDWKIERKAELLALARMMQADENVLLRHKLGAQAAQVTTLKLAKIIAQGITEGVFETDYPEETAEIVHAISTAFSGMITGILLNPDGYDDPEALVRRKIEALQTATERVLGAAPDSLPIIDEQTFVTWLEK